MPDLYLTAIITKKMKKLLAISILINLYYLSINVYYLVGTKAACESFGRTASISFQKELGFHAKCDKARLILDGNESYLFAK